MIPARVPISITKQGEPFVPATVMWRKRRTISPVDFMVDTGAFDIALSEDDASALGVELDELPQSRTPVGGIGGCVRTYDLPDITIVLPCEGPSRPEFRLSRIRVMEGPRDGVRNRDRTSIPSILGRAFLKRNRFVLHYDFGLGSAYLELKD